MQEAPPTTPAIASDVPCKVCGFNLIGLNQAGLCPECGQPVERSLQGNLLRFSAPEYVALLHRGVVLVQAAIILQVLLYIASVATPVFSVGSMRLMPLTASGLSLLCSAMALVGWWMLSSPDPAAAEIDDGATARKAVRVAVAARAVVAALPLVLLAGGSAVSSVGGGIAVSVVSAVVWLAWFVAAMRYLRWLAPRLPSERVGRRSQRMVWLCPLLVVAGGLLAFPAGGLLLGAMAAGLGFLVALILYYNLLEWVRKDLKRVRREQAASAGRPR